MHRKSLKVDALIIARRSKEIRFIIFPSNSRPWCVTINEQVSRGLEALGALSSWEWRGVESEPSVV